MGARCLAAIAQSALFAFPASVALAEAAPASAPRGPLSLDLDGHLGWSQGEQAGGVTLGAAARFRYHVLTAGAGLEVASVIFVNMLSLSGLAGVALPMGPVRLDLLGELGVHAYDGIGRGLLDDDPGTGGALPFAGARLAALARIHRNAARGSSAWVGVTGGYADDLGRYRESYSWHDSGENWFSGEPYDEQREESVVLGQKRWVLLATVSVNVAL